MPNSSISGGIPPVRSLGLLSEEGRSGRLSPTNELSSKNFLERSLKSMANAAAAASSKEDIKCKCNFINFQDKCYIHSYIHLLGFNLSIEK